MKKDPESAAICNIISRIPRLRTRAIEDVIDETPLASKVPVDPFMEYIELRNYGLEIKIKHLYGVLYENNKLYLLAYNQTLHVFDLENEGAYTQWVPHNRPHLLIRMLLSGYDHIAFAWSRYKARSRNDDAYPYCSKRSAREKIKPKGY